MINMKKRLIIIMLCLLGIPVWAKPQLKIIPLQHRFAEELLPVLQPLAGENGSVNAYGNQLVVNAEPAELATIEEVVRKLDVAKRNWRINVKQDRQGWHEDRHVDVAGSASKGNVRVQTPDAKRRMPRGATVTTDERHSTLSQTGDMTLNVLDGAEAFIIVGQQIPYTSYWITLTDRYAHVDQNTEWREVGAGFVVRPRQIGDIVDIEVTPRLSRPGGSGAIDFTELSTHVKVRPGEWVDLGGVLGSRDEVSRAIISHGSSQGSSATRLRIKVE
jgi:hypothetical protein